jgi:NAD(P)-dependent dehydrogenase (short-subunit alcohol dehydrogenase family)
MTEAAGLFSVRDRVVLLTGAGRGIGRVLARAFAERGAHVALASRTRAEAERVAADCRALGVRALAAEADVRSVASIDRMVEGVLDAFGRIDVLVNNAGVFVNAPAVDLSEDDWDLMVDTNVKGVFFCARAVARAMLGQGGRIINVSSALAGVAQEGYVCYGATKAAAEQMTRVMALEWARDGIRVNCLEPGFMDTPLAAPLWQQPDTSRWLLNRIPLERPGRPPELVGICLLLASEAGSYITGQSFLVDGGFLAGGRWFTPDR